jgi:hypothetical protein
MKIASVYGLECVYCGEPATDRDHVVPHSLINNRDAKRTYDGCEVVPACRDCNGALHDRPIVTIAERANWLLTRLRKKLSKMPVWSEVAINELGRTMQSFVRGGQAKRQAIERRLRHLEQVAKLVGLTPGRYWENGTHNLYVN